MRKCEQCGHPLERPAKRHSKFQTMITHLINLIGSPPHLSYQDTHMNFLNPSEEEITHLAQVAEPELPFVSAEELPIEMISNPVSSRIESVKQPIAAASKPADLGAGLVGVEAGEQSTASDKDFFVPEPSTPVSAAGVPDDEPVAADSVYREAEDSGSDSSGKSQSPPHSDGDKDLVTLVSDDSGSEPESERVGSGPIIRESSQPLGDDDSYERRGSERLSNDFLKDIPRVVITEPVPTVIITDADQSSVNGGSESDVNYLLSESDDEPVRSRDRKGGDTPPSQLQDPSPVVPETELPPTTLVGPLAADVPLNDAPEQAVQIATEMAKEITVVPESPAAKRADETPSESPRSAAETPRKTRSSSQRSMPSSSSAGRRDQSVIESVVGGLHGVFGRLEHAIRRSIMNRRQKRFTTKASAGNQVVTLRIPSPSAEGRQRGGAKRESTEIVSNPINRIVITPPSETIATRSKPRHRARGRKSDMKSSVSVKAMPQLLTPEALYMTPANVSSDDEEYFHTPASVLYLTPASIPASDNESWASARSDSSDSDESSVGSPFTLDPEVTSEEFLAASPLGIPRAMHFVYKALTSSRAPYDCC